MDEKQKAELQVARMKVLGTLNDVINEVASNDESICTTIAIVAIAHDGQSVSVVTTPELNGVSLNGHLLKLIQDIDFEHRKRQIGDLAQDTAEKIVLATAPTPATKFN